MGWRSPYPPVIVGSNTGHPCCINCIFKFGDKSLVPLREVSNRLKMPTALQIWVLLRAWWEDRTGSSKGSDKLKKDAGWSLKHLHLCAQWAALPHVRLSQLSQHQWSAKTLEVRNDSDLLLLQSHPCYPKFFWLSFFCFWHFLVRPT